MPRKLVAQDQLLELVNTQLRRHEECADCRFTHIQYHEEDKEGCNWSLTNLRCSGTPGKVCIETANSVAHEARSKYNLY